MSNSVALDTSSTLNHGAALPLDRPAFYTVSLSGERERERVVWGNFSEPTRPAHHAPRFRYQPAVFLHFRILGNVVAFIWTSFSSMASATSDSRPDRVDSDVVVVLEQQYRALLAILACSMPKFQSLQSWCFSQ